MVWVAFDRSVRAVTEFGLDGPVERWAALRDAVHTEVLEQGWNDTAGAFTQSYGDTELDAATLLLRMVGFHESRVRVREALPGSGYTAGDLVLCLGELGVLTEPAVNRKAYNAFSAG